MNPGSLPKYIHSIKALEPPFLLKQEAILEWIQDVYRGQEASSWVKRYACKPPAIVKRGSWVSDFLKEHANHSFVFENAQERNARYQSITIPALEMLYQGASAPQNILHVSCTGYISPSSPQILVSHHQWNTQVAHAYHMGCYAAIPAVRLAHNSDVVHTELCSLHFNPRDTSPEQIIIQSLFADGIIKYSVADELICPALEVIASRELIIPNSQASLTWQTSATGFVMTLDRRVPKILSENLLTHVSSFLDVNEVLMGDLVAAIHPGGPKIIELSQDILSLTSQQVRYSKEVLSERGNMSSATLPHIWQKILADPSVGHGRAILSLAFGPGLTLCMSLFRKRIT